MSTILVIGDIYKEIQYFLLNPPKEEEVHITNNIYSLFGSKAINAARAMVLAGANVKFFGKVGDDYDAESAILVLDSYGFDMELTTKVNHNNTGNISVLIYKNSKNSIILHPGANNLITPEDIAKISFREYDFIYSGTHLPLESLYELIKLCKKNKVQLFLDMPNQLDTIDKSKLKNVDFVAPNRQETQALTGVEILSVDDAINASKLIRKFCLGSILISLDKDGALFLENGQSTPLYFIAPKVDVMDETGAGDILRGIFVTKLLETKNIKDSMKYAIQVASNSVRYLGVENKLKGLLIV